MVLCTKIQQQLDNDDEFLFGDRKQKKFPSTICYPCNGFRDYFVCVF